MGSVLRRLSVLRGDSISTAGDSISTVEDSISTAEAVQYSAVLNNLHSTEPTLYGVFLYKRKFRSAATCYLVEFIMKL